MALVTIQRSSSDSSTGLHSAEEDKSQVTKSKSLYQALRSKSITESFFVVKGAALILRKNECHISRNNVGPIYDLRQHLNAMFGLVRPQDRITLAVRLDSKMDLYSVRYVSIISSIDRFDTEETVMLGFDIVDDKVTVGLVMPIYADLDIKLDGDGGLKLYSNGEQHTVKPLTVQAMWSTFQSLSKASMQARYYNYYPGGISHTWVHVYQAPLVRSNDLLLNEWNLPDEVLAYRSESPVHQALQSDNAWDQDAFLQNVKSRLKELMTTVDLEVVTSKYLRERLEKDMGVSLSKHGKFIDDVILQVFAHMDKASEINEFLLLGSEWNASNYEQLKEKNVGYILNVSLEIDNFFPADFKYMNVRIHDSEEAQLIREWDRTYRFIREARSNKKACLVHCKMGISRSAATVVAFLMKENEWTLEKSLIEVKRKRNCVRPNPGFSKQLEEYEGILQANRTKRRAKANRLVSTGHQCNDDPVADYSNVDGRDFLIKRFMQSVDTYWSNKDTDDGQLDATELRSVGSGAVMTTFSIPRVTKPDKSWIRDCQNADCDETGKLLCDLTFQRKTGPDVNVLEGNCDNDKNDCELDDTSSQELNCSFDGKRKEENWPVVIYYPEFAGSVRRRIMDLENRAQRNGNDMIRTVSSKPESISLNCCASTSRTRKHISKIQHLVRLYSLGLGGQEAKFVERVTAFHRRIFNNVNASSCVNGDVAGKNVDMTGSNCGTRLHSNRAISNIPRAQSLRD